MGIWKHTRITTHTLSATPTAIILTEMAFILVSGLEMTVSRCEIIISRFAITISHPEINFTMPSGNNSLAVNWLSLPPAPTTTPTVLANPCGEGVKMGAAAIKSGTNTINRAPSALIMYII